MKNVFELLNANSYPGRGIIIGRCAYNEFSFIIYFIMGRSENSRNRIFAATEDGIRTQAWDPAKTTDPSLIIYHPVRRLEGHVIVTNGDQTDTIRDGLAAGISFEDSLRGRKFEPDAPNYTPRISGLLLPDGSYRLSILKTAQGDPSCCQRFFFEYDRPIAGQGHFISTYAGDGDPLPSFAGEPVTVAMKGSLETFARRVWDSLNGDNKVSLFGLGIPLDEGKPESIIINKHEGA
ncbi:MAG TPA: inosine monophosphate cyclohydrolase [Clostridiales bacterium]|jgi:IMP cyclohydrolase|nr:inosine monophosphate cyclohydrolase [Clostridiales bacterium]